MRRAVGYALLFAWIALAGGVQLFAQAWTPHVGGAVEPALRALVPDLMTLVLVAALAPACASSDPFRSKDLATLPDTGAVVSEHPLATQAGLEILGIGGNAADAAVATAPSISHRRSRTSRPSASTSDSARPSSITPHQGRIGYEMIKVVPPPASSARIANARTASVSDASPGPPSPNPASQLGDRTIAAPTAAIPFLDANAIGAVSIIDQPIAQITCNRIRLREGSGIQAKVTTVISKATSTAPRSARKRASSPRLIMRPANPAETPANRMNAGAQRWVIHRVANSQGVVDSRSVGLGSKPMKKSRAWSNAISAMTNPRSMSIAGTRSDPGGGITISLEPVATDDA